MEIEKIKICAPIDSLVNFLIDNGFTIEERKVSDYHFHEVSINLKGPYPYTEIIERINIDKIKKVDSKTFSCECHWSTVTLNCK
jgi:hypothetical protein